MSRTVVVTGAGSGIGRALTDLLRDRGDRVVGVDLKDAEVSADLATADGRVAAADAVLERAGGQVDVVVACAGISGVAPELVAVNYFGAVDLLVSLRPALARSAAPRAAVVSSVSATHPADAAVVEACLAGDEAAALAAAQQAVLDGRGRQLYPASKAALARWVRRTSVAPGWADAGIAVNAVAPGVVLTAMTDELFEDPQMRAVMDRTVPMPLNGYSDAVVIARALAWLVSEENTHTTGQVLFVDGGAEATLRGEAVF